jgi:hypothetical protein
MVLGIALALVLAFLVLGGLEVYLKMGSRRNIGSRRPTWGEKNDTSNNPQARMRRTVSKQGR